MSKNNSLKIRKKHTSAKTIMNSWKIFGWNWRSLSLEKLEFTKFLLNKHNPDVAVIWETWLNKQITMYPWDYELYKNWISPYQGVCIIAKPGLVSKVWRNMEQYFVTVQWGAINSVFIIGAYFKKEKRNT